MQKSNVMISREEQLESCKICKNKKFDFKRGIICAFTNEPADFAFQCAKIDIDIDLKQIEENKKKAQVEDKLEIQTGGLSKYGITNGAIAGFILISLSILWLTLGIVIINRIFVYPIILFFIGIGIIIYHFYNLVKQKRKENQQSKQDDIIDI